MSHVDEQSYPSASDISNTVTNSVSFTGRHVQFDDTPTVFPADVTPSLDPTSDLSADLSHLTISNGVSSLSSATVFQTGYVDLCIDWFDPAVSPTDIPWSEPLRPYLDRPLGTVNVWKWRRDQSKSKLFCMFADFLLNG